MAAPLEVTVRAARNKLFGNAALPLTAKQCIGQEVRYGWTVEPQERSLQTGLEWSQGRSLDPEMLPN
jgi:hypothetical protein